MIPDLSQLDVFYGDLTVNRAYLYVRLPRIAGDDDFSLSGEIRGPRTSTAATLPTTIPLVDQGPGPTLLAQAILPEPCFWSPDLPAIYDVTVNFLQGEKTIATARRQLGLRWLGVRGRHLALEAKRWILRGVSTMSTTATAARQWHEAGAAWVTDQLHEGSLAECSEQGALAVAEVGGSSGEIAFRLRQLAAWPAAGVAIVRGEPANADSPRSVAPNLLCLQPLRGGSDLSIQPWAQAIWAEGDDPRWFGQLASRTDLPIIAVRRLIKPLALDQARAACDIFQRDLAPVGQFAGYVV